MVTAAVAGTLLALALTVPLAWKWELGVVRVATAVGLLGAVWGAIVGGLGSAVSLAPAPAGALVAALTLSSAAAALLYRFYRDPERTGPDGDGVVVSPADGTVIYVRRVERGILPVSTKAGRNYTLEELTRSPLESQDATVIGIAMTFLDVHVNRAPVAGRVALQRHFRGCFQSLKLPEAVFENERATTVIERDGLQVAIVQIASRLVRQIVPFVSQDQAVRRGERIGVIRFGSQVDLVLPDRSDLVVTTAVGERVRAGESVIAVFQLAGRPVSAPAADGSA